MNEEKKLMHIGVARRSGRYPWGSGEAPQRSSSFRQEVNELKKQGMSKVDIAKGFGMSTTQLINDMAIEKSAQRKSDSSMALRLSEKGYSNVEIGRRMSINESSVRSLLDPAKQESAAIAEVTANMLRQQVETKKYLDVGLGVETHIGISRPKLNVAIAMLEEDGYKISYLDIPQPGTGKKTRMKVLTKNEVDYVKELIPNQDKIRTVTDWTDDGGRSYLGLVPIKHLDSKRIKVMFDEDGGSDMDGVIQLRRGAEDLSLGGKKYAQVRVGVDETHYMKGMAIYKDDMPDGIDVIYNTNKSRVEGKLGVMKPIKGDEDNPFGSSVHQKYYIDSDGKKQLSPLNRVGFPTKPESGEEGSWGTWSSTLSSQFLSKQFPALAKKQLDLSLDIQKSELKDILSLTNPAVKVRLLDSFSDDCDSKAVHLQAAALPRQSSKVLIPLVSLKEDEAYTNTYKNGTRLVLIRHPHAGPFELPVVTVNNKNKEGMSVLGNALDAIGIHPKTAGILSGADFDGDSVTVVPFGNHIKISNSIKSLSGFDPRKAYPPSDGMRVLTAKNKQTEMGKISNLITDMTLKGASQDEVARAVRHSMVVIDAEKHRLNYTQSYHDNGIAALKVNYQGGTLSHPKGAATLISRSSSDIRVLARRPVRKSDIIDNPDNPELARAIRKNEYSVDPKTGRKIFVDTNEIGKYKVINKGVDTGETNQVLKRIKSTKMYETSDAHTLSSGTAIEKVYGDFANSMKALGDTARRESVKTPTVKALVSAKVTYKTELESLKSKLVIAISNKPKERQALLLANSVIKMKKANDPNLTNAELKKIKGMAIEEARLRTGASKQSIVIEPKEWEAIQAGAVTHNQLTQILNNTKLDVVKQLAMPKTRYGVSDSDISRAKNLLASGYTMADVAEHLGISLSSVVEIEKGG